jgi:hypothetical protein
LRENTQLLKLGAADSPALNLSARFLLWDGDMIALAPLATSSPDGRAVRHVGGSRVKTYRHAYAALTGGARLGMAQDGSSYVTHAMVVDARHMRAMLASFEASAPGAEGHHGAGGAHPGMPRWARALLRALPSDSKSLSLGFSEYASYGSWVAVHAPGDVAVAPGRAWTRHPLGSVWAVAASRLVYPRQAACCPSRRLLAATAAQGWLYTGFEARAPSRPQNTPDALRARVLAHLASFGPVFFCAHACARLQVGHVAWLCGYDPQRSADGYGE